MPSLGADMEAGPLAQWVMHPGATVKRYHGQTGAFIDDVASGGGLSGPVTMKFGPDGNLYVASHWNHQVLRYDGTTGKFIDAFIPQAAAG